MLKQAPRRSMTRRAGEDLAAAEALPAKPMPPRSLATLGLGIAGAILLWAAFPPLNLPWMAWIAPLPWLWLVRLPALPGRRPYLTLWLAGSVHWLLMLQGIRLAHPALYGGWLALSLYLAIYLPIFVGLSRLAVHRLKLSLVVSAPVVWVGLELLRGHLVTGFSNGLLAHTQAEIPLLIQVADLAGGYTLSFVILLVAASLTRIWNVEALRREGEAPAEPAPHNSPARQTPRPPSTRPPARISWWPLLPLAATVLATLLYGNWRLSQPATGKSVAKVALIQGSLDTVFGEDRSLETLDHYRQLTGRATAEHANLDLIVWPESSVQPQEIILEEPLAPLEGVPLTVEQLRANLLDGQDHYHHLLAGEAARANVRSASTAQGTQLLIGTTTMAFGSGPRRMYNSALLVDPRGSVASRYYKTHPVMFGEYIPLGDAIPWLYHVIGMGGGLSVGDGPRVFEIAGVSMAPNICFESTIPHLVRAQLLELERRGTPADVIVNVSNDGWFWGSSILDLHFRSNVFRAVENRKPLLVAANTGISAWIDGNGVARQRGQRRQPEVLFAEVRADGRVSPYHTLGDWPAWICAAACIALAIVGCLPSSPLGEGRGER